MLKFDINHGDPVATLATGINLSDNSLINADYTDVVLCSVYGKYRVDVHTNMRNVYTVLQCRHHAYFNSIDRNLLLANSVYNLLTGNRRSIDTFKPFCVRDITERHPYVYSRSNALFGQVTHGLKLSMDSRIYWGPEITISWFNLGETKSFYTTPCGSDHISDLKLVCV